MEDHLSSVTFVTGLAGVRCRRCKPHPKNTKSASIVASTQGSQTCWLWSARNNTTDLKLTLTNQARLGSATTQFFQHRKKKHAVFQRQNICNR